MGYFVSDTFRTNSLSLVPGGSVVVINESDGTTKAYDKVKNPKAYEGISHTVGWGIPIVSCLTI